jgi:hypothetical protein
MVNSLDKVTLEETRGEPGDHAGTFIATGEQHERPAEVNVALLDFLARLDGSVH